ncbi:hypothetical protein B4099_1790 [Heyndrickxia coagulans]|uniref:Uncharacterized protein n=1 Tax=Heyndrickxia coagulans TaxID=1398 RepID=A0A150KF68_HEYCO|nr:hypothetical protein B4099_1790 [Heyndrickxia coagulans]
MHEGFAPCRKNGQHIEQFPYADLFWGNCPLPARNGIT